MSPDDASGLFSLVLPEAKRRRVADEGKKESASVASGEQQVQPAPVPESVAPIPPQQPEGDAVSQSNPLVSEPTAVPPAQQSGTAEPEAIQPSTPSIPSIHIPFYGSYPITFDFGAQPTEEKAIKKYEEWGIVGHNGIDFGIQPNIPDTNNGYLGYLNPTPYLSETSPLPKKRSV